MSKDDLIKELDLLSDSCESHYAIEIAGYKQGVLDSIELIKKHFSFIEEELEKGAIEIKSQYKSL